MECDHLNENHINIVKFNNKKQSQDGMINTAAY